VLPMLFLFLLLFRVSGISLRLSKSLPIIKHSNNRPYAHTHTHTNNIKFW
jgi:hypothetical protein